MLTWMVITSRCWPSSLFTFLLVTVQIVSQTTIAPTLVQSILPLAQLPRRLMNFGLLRPISFHLPALSPEILHSGFLVRPFNAFDSSWRALFHDQSWTTSKFLMFVKQICVILYFHLLQDTDNLGLLLWRINIARCSLLMSTQLIHYTALRKSVKEITSIIYVNDV
jgi:hypothetical protein